MRTYVPMLACAAALVAGCGSPKVEQTPAFAGLPKVSVSQMVGNTYQANALSYTGVSAKVAALDAAKKTCTEVR